jgi:long-chain fatty acid transport protein
MFKLVCVCIASLGLTWEGNADGLRNPPEGAVALGQGGVRLTEGDDATAISHNPANLMDLTEMEFTPTVTFGYSQKKFTSAMLGGESKSEEPWAVLPGIYIAWPLESDYAWGLGITTPYGQSTVWDKSSLVSQFSPYESSMQTLNINPTFAAKIGKSLYVGVGLDVMDSSLSMNQLYPLSKLTGGAINSSADLGFEGSGVGIGGNAGVTWTMTEKQRIALVYRSPISVEYEGDFTIDAGKAGAGAASALPPSVSPQSDFETDIEFPATVALGYGLKITDVLRVEANVEWIEHSTYDQLTLDVGRNNSLLTQALGSNKIRQNWDDTWTWGLGLDWDVAPNWIVRSGWTYLPTPVPSETLTPYQAEGDTHILAAGLGYTVKNHKIDLAYAYSLMEDRTIANNQNPYYNGTYEFEAHLLSVSYSCSF